MLQLSYNSFFFLIPLFWVLNIGWLFFFLIHSTEARTQSLASCDKNFLVTKKFSSFFTLAFFDILLPGLLCFFFFLIFLRGWVFSFFFSCFFVNNFLAYFILLYSTIFLLGFIYLKRLSLHAFTLDFDFFFALLNFYLFSTLLFLTKSLVAFFFVLELISCFIFYQFVVSKSFFKQTKVSTTSTFARIQNKQILSILFFQYWASFFSSVMLIYIISYLLFVFGSSEWVIINQLFSILVINFVNTDLFLFTCLFLLFTLAFFLKLGFTPVQLFKIEIYKGLPFLSIFFYTIFYFFVYFFVYFFIVFYYLVNYWVFIWYFFFFFFFW